MTHVMHVLPEEFTEANANPANRSLAIRSEYPVALRRLDGVRDISAFLVCLSIFSTPCLTFGWWGGPLVVAACEALAISTCALR
jgi:hypothetical protein